MRTTRVNANNATIEWKNPPRDKIHGKMEGYDIIVEENGRKIDSTCKPVVDTTSCVINDLAPNRNYTVKVAIKNARKQSSFKSVSFTTPAGMH